MVVYNPGVLLQLSEGMALTDQILQIFSSIDTVRTYEGKRVFILALAQLLDLAALGKLPSTLQPHLVSIVRAIATQLKKSIDLKKKQEEEDFEDECDDDDDDDDSEQDITEHEDANTQLQQILTERLEQAAKDQEEDDDDDEDYYEEE